MNNEIRGNKSNIQYASTKVSNKISSKYQKIRGYTQIIAKFT